jgi:hypothetical protein
VRRTRMRDVKATIADADAHELLRVCGPPTLEGHFREPRTVVHCVHLILDEEWEHHLYANRDLRVLASMAS